MFFPRKGLQFSLSHSCSEHVFKRVFLLLNALDFSCTMWTSMFSSFKHSTALGISPLFTRIHTGFFNSTILPCPFSRVKIRVEAPGDGSLWSLYHKIRPSEDHLAADPSNHPRAVHRTAPAKPDLLGLEPGGGCFLSWATPAQCYILIPAFSCSRLAQGFGWYFLKTFFMAVLVQWLRNSIHRVTLSLFGSSGIMK